LLSAINGRLAGGAVFDCPLPDWDHVTWRLAGGMVINFVESVFRLWHHLAISDLFKLSHPRRRIGSKLIRLIAVRIVR